LTECIHTQARSVWPADQSPAAIATETQSHATPSSRSSAAPIPCDVPTTHSPHDRHFFASRGMVSQHQGQLFSAETRAFAVSREIDRIADMITIPQGSLRPYGWVVAPVSCSPSRVAWPTAERGSGTAVRSETAGSLREAARSLRLGLGQRRGPGSEPDSPGHRRICSVRVGAFSAGPLRDLAVVDGEEGCAGVGSSNRKAVLRVSFLRALRVLCVKLLRRDVQVQIPRLAALARDDKRVRVN
jgi:hypothetical protein